MAIVYKVRQHNEPVTLSATTAEKEPVNSVVVKMDKGSIFLHKPINQQLKKVHAPFQEVTKEKFNEFGSKHSQLQQLRTLIYRTTDIELENGDSKVKFYNLCYLKANTGTKYFVSELTFVVPPWNFLGEKEEITIVQWLSSDKGKFLRNWRSSKTKQHVMRTSLTEKEKSEIEQCMKVFEQLPVDQQVETKEQNIECEMPNFKLGFDFLSEHV